VLELGDRLGGLESESSGGLLHGADHGGRSTDKGLDVLGGGRAPVL
jgi:hypothetical protein